MTQTGSISFPSIPASQDQTIVTIDLVTAKVIGAMDLYGCSVTGSATCYVQLYASNDDLNYSALGPGVPVYQTARHLRVPAAPSNVASYRYVRIVLVDGAPVSGETLSATAATVLEQADPDERIRFWPFSAAESRAYMLALTGRNADVYRDGAFLASIPLPHNASQIARLRKDKRLDTGLAWHENVPTHKILRDGDDFSWISEPAVFDNLPNVQFDGTSYFNGTNEVQRINFKDFATNDTFNILFDGERTSSITYAASFSTTVASIDSALEALSNLGSGQVTVTETGAREVTITFTGDAGQINWPELFVTVVDSASGIATVATVTEGKEGGEPIASAARGYFRCGLFWSGRTNQFGAKELPLTAIASQYGDYFNFNQASNRATDGLEFVIDGDDDDGIRAALKARYPLLFTTSGVYFIPVDALDGEKPPGAIEAAPFGFEDTIEPLRFDGSAVYVQQGGKVIRELYWQGGNVGQGGGWVSTDLSLRASHLIVSPIDACVRPAGRLNQTNVYILICGNGEAATLTRLDEQNVSGWARDNTPNGTLLAASADKLGRVYMAVRRQVGDDVVYSIETEEDGLYLDGSVTRSLASASTISDLGHLEGQAVYVLGEEGYYGPFTVTSAAITLSDELTGDYEIGLLFDAEAQVLDVRETPDGKSLAGRYKQVHVVKASVLNSIPPRIRHLEKDWPLELPDEEVETDTEIADSLRPVTGWVEVEGLQGQTRDVDFTLYRPAPGPFNIRAIQIEASVQ